MRRAALVLLLACACGSDEIGEPLTLDVEVTLVGTTTLAIDRIRIAGLYHSFDASETVGDIAVTATGTPEVVALVPPTSNFRSAMTNLYLSSIGSYRMRAVPVRYVAYLDEDGDGVLGGGFRYQGPDRLVGLSNPIDGHAWIPELASQLRSLPPEALQDFYGLTDDRYQDFVAASNVQTASDEFGLLGRRPSPMPVQIDLTRFPTARIDLLCDRFRDEGQEIFRADVRVDPSAGGDALCALELPRCGTATVADLEPPAIPPPEPLNRSYVTYAMCRRSGRLEALVVEEQRVSCFADACRCDLVVTSNAIVTATTARPEWWPCGDTAIYCDSDLPLYRADPECLRAPESGD